MLDPSATKRWLLTLGVVLCAFVAGFGVSYWQANHGDPSQIEGLLWPDPPRLSSFDLIDHRGDPFTADDMRGRWSLVFFGFTNCPDICPTTLDTLAHAYPRLAANAAFRDKGQVVFVSVDPERDTQAHIAQYVTYFNPAFIGVTAAVVALKALARDLGVLFMQVPQAGGAYTVDHSAGIFVIDPELRLVSVLTPPHNVQTIVTRFNDVSAFIEATL